MSSAPENVPAEEAAWAEVLLAWEDEERHRAYLARFSDLEGLALAGRRYRDVLAERPDDAIAARLRDEVVKRAMAQGLASLPRTVPGAEKPRVLVRVLGFTVATALGAAAWYAVQKLGGLAGAHP
ncbi:MAG TPA: hypothetical protein VIW03_03180 [Anaeromyxobacter sp.]